MTLGEYLTAQSAARWSWGRVDCVQFGLQWARESTGRPLTAFSAYSGREGAMAVLETHGGLERIVRDWMVRNGFDPTDTPDDGDIGLAPVERRGEGGLAGFSVVIRSGPWWIGKTPRGIASVAVEGIPTWRVS